MAKKLIFWLTKKTEYNKFSEEFSSTRKTPLSEFSLLKEHLQNAKKVLYVGCGNGRNIPLLQELGAEVIGLDASEGLLEEAKKNVMNNNFVHAKAESLPFNEESFDGVVAFASLHHLTNKKHRQKAFSEVFRVLESGGVFCGTVWNLFQKRFDKNEKQAKTRALFLPWWNKNDFLIPWGQKKLPRLYYRFSPKELEKILKESGFCDIEIFSQKEKGEKGKPLEGKNICFVAKKQ